MRIRECWQILLGTAIALLATGDSLEAQVQTIGGNQSGGGGGATQTQSRATGGGGGGASQGGVGGAGFNPSSNFGSGMSGFGNTGFGNSGFGNSSFGGNQAGGFIGRNTQGTFVGNTQAGQQRFSAQTPNFGGARGGGGGNFNQSRQSTGRNLRILRPRLRIAFVHPSLKTESVTASLRTRLGSTSSMSRYPGVQASIDEKYTVTLRGTVASQNDRKLAELLAGFEPGVRSVKNEITVAESSTKAVDSTSETAASNP